jgi:hypothetical protein
LSMTSLRLFTFFIFFALSALMNKPWFSQLYAVIFIFLFLGWSILHCSFTLIASIYTFIALINLDTYFYLFFNFKLIFMNIIYNIIIELIIFCTPLYITFCSHLHLSVSIIPVIILARLYIQPSNGFFYCMIIPLIRLVFASSSLRCLKYHAIFTAWVYFLDCVEH